MLPLLSQLPQPVFSGKAPASSKGYFFLVPYHMDKKKNEGRKTY
jgi:hypothetical protein